MTPTRVGVNLLWLAPGEVGEARTIASGCCAPWLNDGTGTTTWK